MVNPVIPSDYTFSPSEGTPHLTINHDVAADLDSTNAFEGNLTSDFVSPPPLPPLCPLRANRRRHCRAGEAARGLVGP